MTHHTRPAPAYHLIILTLLMLVWAPCSIPDTYAATNIFINEIHYDNSGADIDEAVEIAGPAGSDLAGWSLVAYNGGNGAPYSTISLDGTLSNQCAGSGTRFWPMPGLQNGAPDGIALVDDSGTVVQFLSYEGTFTATAGPAAGITSLDIGVIEDGNTPAGFAVQLSGSGKTPADFSWNAPAPATFGMCNTDQTFVSDTPEPAVTVTNLRTRRSGCAVNQTVIALNLDNLNTARTYTLSARFYNGDETYMYRKMSGISPRVTSGTFYVIAQAIDDAGDYSPLTTFPMQPTGTRMEFTIADDSSGDEQSHTYDYNCSTGSVAE